jgi:hypothetical protein
MRKISFILIIIAVCAGMSYAQYKEIPYETRMKLKSNNLILGFINPKNFSWTHSVNFSYQTFGNSSYSIASYTGTLNYKVLKNLDISADVTMQYSPFASINGGNAAVNKDFQNSLEGVYLSRLSLSYRPLKNMFININYFDNRNYNWYDDYFFSRYGGY